MEPECSLPHSQAPATATCPSPEPDQSSPLFPIPRRPSTKIKILLVGLLHVTGQRIKVLFTNLLNISDVAQLSVTKLRAGRPENLSSIPDKSIDLSLRLCVCTVSGAVFPGAKAARTRS